MLTAMYNGNRVYASDVTKTDENGNKNIYYCPICNQELILRQGTKNIWHFSHKGAIDDDEICPFTYKGESMYHQMMKQSIKNIIEENNTLSVSELEYPIGKYIADYYCEVNVTTFLKRKVAVECVYKHTDIKIFRAKTQYYADNNIYVLWIFDLNRFLSGYNFKKEVRINEMIKEAHTMYYGKIIALNAYNDDLYALHFDSAERYNEYMDNIYYLKRTKTINDKEIKSKILKKFNINMRDMFLPYDRKIADFNIVKWWSNNYR